MPHEPHTDEKGNGGSGSMIPPRGFKAEQYPLRHKLLYSFGLSMKGDTQNSAFAMLIHSSSDMDVETNTVQVNPHNTAYETDAGPLVRQMSIIDKLNLSIRFNMTSLCNDKAHTSGLAGAEVFSGDGISHIKLLWRPIFFSFPEKLDAADDDTTTTVAAILALTKDATNEDVVPLTTNKLPVTGPSDLSVPISTVNAVQVKEDFNMTTDLTAEDHVWDETLFQEAMRRYTNKGALKACVGRTRFVNLSRQRPYKTFYISKFVPRAIRRIVPYSFMGIQIHMPADSDVDQDYMDATLTGAKAHVGVKLICNYHEWNMDHDQGMGSQV